jgi:hypothetical protein
MAWKSAQDETTRRGLMQDFANDKIPALDGAQISLLLRDLFNSPDRSLRFRRWSSRRYA